MKYLFYILIFGLIFPLVTVAGETQIIDSLQNHLQRAKGAEKVMILIKLSELNRSVSLSDCENYAIRAINLAEKIHSDSLAGLASKSLGVSYYLLGKTPKALSYFKKGYAFFKAANNKKGISDCVNDIGLVYDAWSKYDEAYKYYKESFEIEKELKNEKGMATSLLNIGNINYYRKQYADALDDFFQAFNHFSTINNLDGIGMAYLNIGVIYNQLMDFPKAIEFLQKSQDIYSKTGDVRNLSRVLNNMADIYSEHTKKYKKALLLYDKVLQMKINIGSKVGVALVKNNLGVLYGHMDNLSMAETYFRESLKIYNNLEDKSGQCLVYYNWGLVLQASGKHKAALDKYLRSLALAKAIGLKEYINDNYKNLFKSYAALGEYGHFNKYYNLYETNRDTLAEAKLKTQVAELETRYKVKQLIKKDQNLEQKSLNQLRELRRLYVLLTIISLAFIAVIIALFFYFRLKRANSEVKNNKEQG